MAEFVNTGLNGEYKGYIIDDLPQEYWLWIFPKRPKYHITQSIDHPLYVIDDKGRKLTPRREYDSDFASIPPPFDRIWSPAVLRLSGMLHDDGCKNEGLWQIMDDGTQKFLPLSRLGMDQLMAQMAPAELKLQGKGIISQWFARRMIFWGVRLGSYIGVGLPERKSPKNNIDINWPPIRHA
jgi:hypothetical protein